MEEETKEETSEENTKENTEWGDENTGIQKGTGSEETSQ